MGAPDETEIGDQLHKTRNRIRLQDQNHGIEDTAADDGAAEDERYQSRPAQQAGARRLGIDRRGIGCGEQPDEARRACRQCNQGEGESQG